MQSCVNLAEAYMGVGRIREAEREIRAVYELAKVGDWKHELKKAALCYGNILALQGRYSESLSYYEEGINLTREINHNWDLIFGSIWKELCLTEIRNPNSLDKLVELKRESDQRGYMYLSALSATFSLLSAVVLNQEFMQADEMLKAVDKQSTPGLYAQAIAACILLTNSNDQQQVTSMLQATLTCEGIKGRPQFIAKAFEASKQVIEDQDLLGQFYEWEKKYINPLNLKD